MSAPSRGVVVVVALDARVAAAAASVLEQLAFQVVRYERAEAWRNDGSLRSASVTVVAGGRGSEEQSQLLGEVRRRNPMGRNLVVEGEPSVRGAVTALRRGATDYGAPTELYLMLQDVVLATTNTESSPTPTELTVLGECPPMRELRDTVRRVAQSDAPVLLLGESGTGKEVVARAVHRASSRAEGTFLAVNCGAVSESLLDSELFGHVRGAFTGAELARRGLFEEASGGVILLDEVESTPPSFQAKLLRVLEDGVVRPVGSSMAIATDVRVIAASSVDLIEAVRRDRFRSDLFYRLNVVSIELPPLRQRGDDIVLLALHFLRGATEALGCEPMRISDEAIVCLRVHSWPGNVRELRNVMDRAALFAMAQGKIEVAHLPPALRAALPLPSLPYRKARSEVLRGFLDQYLKDLLSTHGGNVSRAAKTAGVPRQTLHRLLRQLRTGPASGTK